MGVIGLARVYDQPGTAGRTFLVERLWPRGLRRDALRIEGWLKEVAPSTELRRWFAHDPAKWPEFRRRYAAELDARPQSWQPILVAADSADVTLLYSARDRDRNSAVALRDYLEERRDELRGNRVPEPGSPA